MTGRAASIHQVRCQQVQDDLIYDQVSYIILYIYIICYDTKEGNIKDIFTNCNEEK